MMRPVREIVLDTETTGLDVTQGHRVIEIGCVELLAAAHSALLISQGDLAYSPAQAPAVLPSVTEARPAVGLRVIRATPDELAAHARFPDVLDQQCPDGSVRRRHGPSMRN